MKCKHCAGLIIHDPGCFPNGPTDKYSNCGREVKPMDEIEKKRCNKCKIEFPPTNEFFSNNKATPDGLERWCKACKKNTQADYRLKKAKERNKPAAARRERNKSIRNPAPIAKKPQTDLPVPARQTGTQTGQLTGASPAEIVIALRKGMAAEIVAMIQEKYGL